MFFAENEEEEEESEQHEEQEAKRPRTENQIQPKLNFAPIIKDAFSVEFEATFLQALTSFFAQFDPLIPMTVTQQGISIVSIDSAHIACVGIKLFNLKKFTPAKCLLAFDCNVLAKVIETMSRGNVVILSHKPNSTLLDVRAIHQAVSKKKKGPVCLERFIDYRIQLIDDDRDMPMLVDAPGASVEMHSVEFFDILFHLAKCSDLVTLTLAPTWLRFAVGNADGEGGEHTVSQQTLDGKLQNCIFQCHEEITETVSLKFLLQLKPLASLSKSLVLVIPKEAPVRLQLQLEQGEFYFYVAPHIKE